MQLESSFSKMQFKLTGKRFSGVNISKTRFEFNLEPSKKTNSVSFAIIFKTEIDYMEVDDKIEYLQYASVEIDINSFKDGAFNLLKTISIQFQNELIRRYQSSRPYKLFELPVADKMKDEDLNARLQRLISDYRNGVN